MNRYGGGVILGKGKKNGALIVQTVIIEYTARIISWGLKYSYFFLFEGVKSLQNGRKCGSGPVIYAEGYPTQ